MSTMIDEHCEHNLHKEECLECIEAAAANTGGLSVADATMDQMVQRASTPNLATLFQRGKDAGLLTAGKAYGES